MNPAATPSLSLTHDLWLAKHSDHAPEENLLNVAGDWSVCYFQAADTSRWARLYPEQVFGEWLAATLVGYVNATNNALSAGEVMPLPIMKTVLITLGVLALIGGALLVFVLFRAAAVIRTAHGQALYSSVGAWKRIQEFAYAEGKSNYVAEADSKLALLEGDLKQWRESAPAGTDFAALEKRQDTAYKTTDQNIKNGQNPLAYLDASAQQQPGDTSPAGAGKVVGMSDFDYLACDGGPHLVLPKELSRRWKGAGSMLGVLNPLSDYRRACAAVTNQHMALLPVGRGQAMVLAAPPLSAWGRSPEGWIDIYYLEAWPDTNTDAMLKRAVAATPTSAMTNTGKVMTLTQPGLILLFAGDKPGSTAYGEYAIPLDSGNYQLLEGHYKAGNSEEVYVYRLRPKGS